MTKKHFKRAAELVRTTQYEVHYKRVLEDFCCVFFSEFNPRFDEDKFREACRKEEA